MSKFIVCTSFLEGCAADPALFADVLFEFPKDNDLMVCVDAPQGKIIESYNTAAQNDKNNLIGAWLYCMINRSSLSFENLGVAISTDRLKFFELSISTGASNPLLVWSKVGWKMTMELMPEVWVMDRAEGKKAVKKAAKGKEIKKVVKKKGSAGGVNISGTNIQIGNLQSDNSIASVGNIYGRAIIDLEENFGTSNSEILSEIRKVQNELKSASPNKGVLEKSWARLVALAPGVTTVASAVSAVSAILGHP